MTPFKVAPYSFMTARALMMSAVVICARSHEIVRFSWHFMTSTQPKKAKLTVKFVMFPSVNFFLNLAHFEILTLPSTYYFLEKFCRSNSVKWSKIRNQVIPVKPSERPIFFPLQNVSKNHPHKIGKFKKISPWENQNIKE